ncbi:hypothetical protein CH380_17775 [Leptospira adleri]|uniref:Uncharacterized protein n=1 Tax=Leptospira adleri TaxID=2023186 RepID=A0A2M9YK53_9LEPT|nr:hypothetical protein CH380_17775 [Leptospira adleri]PJZ61637.1 hypothetical protein CH376_12155 [Leptospira adleri]
MPKAPNSKKREDRFPSDTSFFEPVCIRKIHALDMKFTNELNLSFSLISARFVKILSILRL